MGAGERVRFGLALSTSAQPGADPVGDARHAEALGFDVLTVSDHLHGTHPTFETWTLLTWVGAATTRIRLAPTVLGLPYRPPPVVAKMAESLDRLTGGRFVLGLGGGASDAEAAAFGLTIRSAREKVDALEEAIRIIRGLWTEETFTFHGKHFHVEEASIQPKPTRPIPIWLGTYGRRALEVTGRLADGWNPSLPYAPPEVAAAMLDRVRQAAERAGRDPGTLELAYNVPVLVREDAAPHQDLVTGGPEEVAERLAGLVRLGFDTLVFWNRGGREGRERLAHEVIPLVGQAMR